MAVYKQYVYDFQDRTGTVYGKDSTANGKLDVNKEMVATGKTWSKVGVQGPPGMSFMINNSSSFVLGPSGIYEFEGEIYNFKIISSGSPNFNGHYNIVIDYRED